MEYVNAFMYSVVASNLHDEASLDRILAPIRATLDALDGLPVEGDMLTLHTPHVIVVATGGTERAIVDLVEERHRNAPWEPVVLIAHPLHNSLPSSLEAMAHLRGEGITGRVVQVAERDEPATTIADLAAIHRFQHARLGLVGAPSDWLVASVPDRDAFHRRWGIELVDVDIAQTIQHHGDAHDVDVQPVAVKFTRHGEPTVDTIAAAALHPALATTIKHQRLDAVSVRCFDFITELQTSGCIALAQLNDSGIVAGCEGDVASTVAMMVARELLDQPAWIANPAMIDTAERELLLAHCTVAPSMVEDVELHTHFESGLGIGLRGTFAPGPVTLMRLGGDELQRHWFADAEIIGTGSAADLCRTQVSLRVDGPIDSLLEDPLGNHLVMVQGHHRRRLERWWSLAFADS